MGFLDILGLEKTEGEVTPKVESNSSKTTVPKLPTQEALRATSSTSARSAQPTSQVSSPDNEDIQKFNEHIEKVFNDANLPGPDYFEFDRMCQAMSTLPNDAKFPAVFQGLHVQGLTKEKLVDSAQQYIRIIEDDNANFQREVAEKILGAAQKKKAEAEAKRVSLKEKIEMIAQLQAELTTDNAEIERITAEAESQEAKATEKISTYNALCSQRVSRIRSDIQLIGSIIK